MMLPDEAGVTHNHKLITSLRLRANGKKSVCFPFEESFGTESVLGTTAKGIRQNNSRPSRHRSNW